MNVFTRVLKNEKGMTLIEALLSLFITLLLLQALPFVLKSVWVFSQQPPNDDIPIYQFYRFIEQDLYKTRAIETLPDGVRLQKQNGDWIDIEQYGQIIRRQVNGQGHQWLLQEVQSLEVQSTSNGFKLILTQEGGARFEKRFTLYP